MSLHESLSLAMMVSILLSVLWKWSKSILVVINLEMLSIIIISNFYFNSVLSSILLLLLIFFVSEALVIISALYSSMSYSGVMNSMMIFY